MNDWIVVAMFAVAVPVLSFAFVLGLIWLYQKVDVKWPRYGATVLCFIGCVIIPMVMGIRWGLAYVAGSP